MPLIGQTSTVTTLVDLHPLAIVKLIVAVPADTPATAPCVAGTLATVGSELLQPPAPDAARYGYMVVLSHTVDGPVIGDAPASIVTDAVALQPVPKLYVMVEGPATMPVTIPFESIGAMLGLLLLQVPPVVALPSVVVAPVQALSVPVIADGPPFTVTMAVV
jgi:hypothetical protein